jgi:hypothetical protein
MSSATWSASAHRLVSQHSVTTVLKPFPEEVAAAIHSVLHRLDVRELKYGGVQLIEQRRAAS